MMEDRTGWEIIFDGTPAGRWGRYLLPPRAQNPSEIWTTTERRRYKKSGLYSKSQQTADSEPEVRDAQGS